jgi:AhpD family alkylhydroperoxidase
MSYTEHRDELQGLARRLGKALPGSMQGFQKLHQGALAEGALSAKVKELIALGIAISVRCEGCLAFHVKDALKVGATREEILDVIGVAILMGGGPAMVYGCEALKALDEFSAETA